MSKRQDNSQQITRESPPPQSDQSGCHWAAIAAAFAGLIIFMKLAYNVHTGQTQENDIAVTAYVEKFQNIYLYKLALFLSSLGGTLVIVGLTALTTLYFIMKGRFKPDGAVMVFATTGGLGLMTVLKHSFFRPRAYHIYDHLGSSFPSGHVLFALTVYGLLVHWSTINASPQKRALLWLVVGVVCLLVGFGRVYVGAHYVTDVIAGLAIAVPWLFMCISLAKRFKKFKST